MVIPYFKEKSQIQHNLKNSSIKEIYNYAVFDSPINQNLSEGLLKRRARDWSGNKFQLKDKSCETCGSCKDIQRHHVNYTDPTNIKFLCRKCHMKLHKKSKNINFIKKSISVSINPNEKGYTERIAYRKSTKRKLFEAIEIYKKNNSDARYRKITNEEILNRVLDYYIET